MYTYNNSSELTMCMYTHNTVAHAVQGLNLFRSLEARMTALFSNSFFKTVDEDEKDSVYDEDWRAMEIKLQVQTIYPQKL